MPDRPELKSGSKSEETRERILTAALALFHERGFEAATMRDIAEKSGVATGAAYYYFSSKDAIVLAFYERAAQETAPRIGQILESTPDLRKRLAGILEVKLGYFGPSRRLLTTLAAHVDPGHPVSPFSEATRSIREQDIDCFRRAVAGSRQHIADDIAEHLPRLLWMYQMALILYWICDRSPGQKKTAALVEGTLRLIVKLIQVSSLPLMRPFRRQVVELCRTAWE
jgi:AcrR family transcriptional regulator